ncbi:MAG: MFS transporter [Gammaproteobacteria bacterium]|nr:MFS transporter [Gammaproteobacteria bacterium]
MSEFATTEARSPRRVIVIVCLAQTLAQLGAFVFPALLPDFIDAWQLTHSEAGLLAGIFFGAYACAVPVLVTLTDRLPARRVYLFAVLMTTLAHLGMAFLAEGFWTGLVFRVLAGVGWAGTYMVGLRALTDELDGSTRSRGVAFHAASIGVSGALSFVLAGYVSASWDWHWAFVVASVSSAAALCLAFVAFPRRAPQGQAVDTQLRAVFDFRPVFRNRSVMAYTTGYFAHTWEMFVLRSWAVTFLVFAASGADAVTLLVLPTVAAMLMELTGTISSVAGNELALRVGRQKWIVSVMFCSMLIATFIGFSSGLGYGVAVGTLLIYNALIYADSASLTAGTIGSADPNRRGATLAVHAMMGYTGGFIGPVVLGGLLDALGGESVQNWGVAFMHVAVVGLIGPLAFRILKPKDLDGDKASDAPGQRG